MKYTQSSLRSYEVDTNNPPCGYEVIKCKSTWRFYVDMWVGSSKPYKTRRDCIKDAWLHYSLFNVDN